MSFFFRRNFSSKKKKLVRLGAVLRMHGVVDGAGDAILEAPEVDAADDTGCLAALAGQDRALAGGERRAFAAGVAGALAAAAAARGGEARRVEGAVDELTAPVGDGLDRRQGARFLLGVRGARAGHWQRRRRRRRRRRMRKRRRRRLGVVTGSSSTSSSRGQGRRRRRRLAAFLSHRKKRHSSSKETERKSSCLSVAGCPQFFELRPREQSQLTRPN